MKLILRIADPAYPDPLRIPVPDRTARVAVLLEQINARYEIY